MFFCGQCLYFSFQHKNNAYEVILYTTALLCFPKNLIPWRDLSPGFLVHEADAMSTAPRRQGGSNKSYFCQMETAFDKTGSDRS
jgi:hypothetical protein